MNSAGEKKRRRENVTQRASASITREIPAPRRSRRPRVYFRRLVFQLVCHLTKIRGEFGRGQIQLRAVLAARKEREAKEKRKEESNAGEGAARRNDATFGDLKFESPDRGGGGALSRTFVFTCKISCPLTERLTTNPFLFRKSFVNFLHFSRERSKRG
jgi:hypothetical protein